MTDSTAITSFLRGSQNKCLLLGAVALAVSIVGLLVDHQQFFVGYLEAYLLWLGVTLGCFGILMINNLVGGAWGVLIRCFLEAGSSLIPMMALLFVPICFGIHDLYVWAHPDIVAANPVLHSRAGYMNPMGFIIRAGVYFLLWMLVRFWLNRNPLLAETLEERRRLQIRSGIGIVLCGYSISIAAMDWVMSLHTTFYSNIFGLIFVVGELLSAMAFCLVMTVWIKERVVKAKYPTQSLHDSGNLLLVFTLFWSYISFSQYLIIWSAQLPEEFLYYNQRSVNGWKMVSFGLIVLHFLLPFLLLLQRAIKRKPIRLMRVAVFLLIMRCVDVVWWIGPVFYKLWHVQWVFLATLVGIGGVWMWAFLGRLDAASVGVVPISVHEHHEAHGAGSGHEGPQGPEDRPHGEKRK